MDKAQLRRLWGILLGHSQISVRQALAWKNFLFSQDEKVRLLSPDEKCPCDVLIIPNSGGYNTNSAAFLPHFRIPPPYPGQDQYYEFFMRNTLDWYAKKEIKMAGTGTGRCMIYEQVLKGKLDWSVKNTPDPLVCFHDIKCNVSWKEDNFTGEFVMGFENSDMDLIEDQYYDILKHFFTNLGNGNGGTKVPDPNPKAPVPLLLKEKEPKPQLAAPAFD